MCILPLQLLKVEIFLTIYLSAHHINYSSCVCMRDLHAEKKNRNQSCQKNSDFSMIFFTFMTVT